MVDVWVYDLCSEGLPTSVPSFTVRFFCVPSTFRLLYVLIFSFGGSVVFSAPELGRAKLDETRLAGVESATL